MIGHDQRVAIFGHTGCGKTTFARRFLLPHYKRFVALDPKGTFKMPGVPIMREKFVPKRGSQIIRSNDVSVANPLWTHVINTAWKQGDWCIYCDEMVLITKAEPILPALASAIQTGRERGIGLVMLTQSPIRAPRQMLEQSDHFFIFHLPYVRSRNKVVEFTGDIVQREMSRKWYPKGGDDETIKRNERYDFIYYNVEERGTQYYRNTPKGIR